MLVREDAEPSVPYLLRTALRQRLLPPPARERDRPNDIAEAADWLSTNSIRPRELEKAQQLRRGLDAIARTLDGSPAAATTIRRKRAVLNNALQYAVEIEELATNNLDKVGWRAPKVADVVDRRVVINPRRARELLTAVTYVGPTDRGRHLRGFFACLYYAGLRAAEAQGLRLPDCELPDEGWGHLNLAESRPESNRRWTDSDSTHERRGLKHRAANAGRRVPIPPELVAILRQHVTEFGIASDGRLFHTRRGGVIGSNYAAAWSAARPLALTPTQVETPIVRRRTTCDTPPYRFGSTPASQPPRSPSVPGTASTSSCGSTHRASTAANRSQTLASTRRSTRTETGTDPLGCGRGKA